ncbi:MAG: hypothetical protein WJ289_01750 [Ferrovum myxofaciens]|jgi:GST-like protein|nr:hypothetical protein [Ferrovum myxofaciens]
MESKRQLDVLDRQLDGNRLVSGNEYTIADVLSKHVHVQIS